MANINSVITYNANLSPAQAQIKALTGQIAGLTAAFNTLDKSALAAQRSLATAFATNVGQIGGFTAQTVQAHHAVENFGKQLAANRLTMRQYFREAVAGYTKQNSLMKQLAAQQVRYQQSVAVPMGGGQMMMLTPATLSATGNAAAMAAQKFSIFNQLVNGGATAMLNWGKNTQWAGRQLMVGFTVPLMMFTAVASKQFRDLDKELTRFQKVYGSDLGGAISQSTAQMREEVKSLAFEISRTYGIAAKETAALAADIAATGQEGENLLNSVQQTTRLAVLGEVDRQEAMKATLALQSAFRMDTNQLAESINFLNAVENQTSATLEDLATAIPKVGPVVRSLGGDIEDLATLLVAMREGGIPAAEAANALKSGLASLINPTKQASEVAKKFGIDLVGLVEANKGQLMPTIFAMRDALSGLDDFGRSRVIEQIFGKYQFARISALFDNIGRNGSQTQAVLELAAKSSTELAAVANQEIKTLTESTAVRFQRALEDLKNAIMPLGQALTETLIPIFQKIGEGFQMFAEFFKALPEPVKNFAKYGVAIAALAGPVIMLVGLFGNLIANGVKFGMMIVRLGARIAGLKVDKFELLNSEVMAAKFGVDNLTTSFTNQESAMKRLVTVMSTYETSLRRLTTANPALFIPGAIPGRGGSVPIRRTTGSMSPEKVPGGYGGGDKIPALLEPGEMVVRKEAASQYAPFILAMNKGTLPGFENGTQQYRGSEQRRFKSSVGVPLALGPNAAAAGIVKGFSTLQPSMQNIIGLFYKDIAKSIGIPISNITNDFYRWQAKNKGLIDTFTKEYALAAGDVKKQRALIKAIDDKYIKDMGGAKSDAGRFAMQASAMEKENTIILKKAQQILIKHGVDLNDAAQVTQFYKQNLRDLSAITDKTELAAMQLLKNILTPGSYATLGKVLSATIPLTSMPGGAARTAATVAGRYKDTGIPQQFISPLVRNKAFEQRAFGAGFSKEVQMYMRDMQLSVEHTATTLGQIGKGVANNLQNLTKKVAAEARKILGIRSPSTEVDAEAKPIGVGIAQGAINGLRKGMQQVLSRNPRIVAGPVGGTGIESISNAQKIAQADKTILKYKELQSKATSQRVIAEQQISNINAEIHKIEQQERKGQITFVELMQRRNALYAQRAGFQDDLKAAENKEKIYQDKINEQKQRIANANAAQARAEQQEAQNAQRRAAAGFGVGFGGQAGYYGGGSSPYAPSPRSKTPDWLRSRMDQAAAAARSGISTGPSANLKDGLDRTGQRGMGMMGAAMAISMAASTITMFSGATGEAAGKLMMFTTALTTAIFTMQAMSGMGLGGKLVGGVSALGRGASGIGQRMVVASGGTVASNLATRGVTAAGGAGIRGGIGSLLASGGGALGAGGGAAIAATAGIGAALAVTGVSLYLYKKSLDEARERAMAAFKDPVATVEFFGKKVKTVTETLQGIQAAHASQEFAAINDQLREAVRSDYATLIEKIKNSAVSVGAADLGAAYTQMLISGLTAEEALDSIKAIAAESGTAGGEAYAKAFGDGLLESKSPEQAFEKLLGMIDPNSEYNRRRIESLQAERATIRPVTVGTRGFAGYTSEQRNQMGSIEEAMQISGETYFATLKAAIELSQTAPELVAESSKAIREGFLNLSTEGGGLFGMGQSAQEVAFDSFKNMIGELNDPALNQIMDSLQNAGPEAQALAMELVGVGGNLSDAANAAGVFDETLARVALDNARRMAVLNQSLQDAKDALVDFAETPQIEDKLEEGEKAVERLQNKIEKYGNSREKQREAMEKSFDATQEGLQDEIDSLNKQQEAIQESTDIYIDSLEKKAKADSFYSGQRKTAFSALEKLASGDVFGFLQEREQLSQQSQEFAYDKTIQGIEDRRDMELDAIDEVITKKEELMDLNEKAHEDQMDMFDKETEKHSKELEKRLRQKTQDNQEMKDLVDEIKSGEITSYEEVTKAFGVELADRYKQLVINEMNSLALVLKGQVMAGSIKKEDAERQLIEMFNALNEGGYYSRSADGGIRSGGVSTYSQLQGYIPLPSLSGGPANRTTDYGAGSPSTSAPSGPQVPPGTPANYNGARTIKWNGNTWNWDETSNQWQVQLATGGYIRRYKDGSGGGVTGPGGPKSDVIPALLSNGEYVIQASSVGKYGKDMMDNINAGKFAYGGLVKKYADGGYVKSSGDPIGDKSPGFGKAAPVIATFPTLPSKKKQIIPTTVTSPGATPGATPGGQTETWPTGTGGDAALSYARSQVGEPYVDTPPGAKPPNTWDCTKLTAWAWAVATGADPNRGYYDENAKVKLTPYSYAQVNEVAKIGDTLDPKSWTTGGRAGDLLFFFKNGAHHASMYDGNGGIVEASSPSTGVRTESVFNAWNQAHFSSAGRPRGYADGGLVQALADGGIVKEVRWAQRNLLGTPYGLDHLYPNGNLPSEAFKDNYRPKSIGCSPFTHLIHARGGKPYIHPFRAAMQEQEGGRGLSPNQYEVGDAVFFRGSDGEPTTHVGLLSNQTGRNAWNVIHSSASKGAVVEEGLGELVNRIRKNEPGFYVSSVKRLQSGGPVFGPGGPTSDSIPAMLSNGEYVISADSVKKYGRGFLDKINSGQLPTSIRPEKFRAGTSMPMSSMQSANPGYNMPRTMSTPSFNLPSGGGAASTAVMSGSRSGGGATNGGGGRGGTSVRNNNNIKIVINSPNANAKSVANEVVQIINNQTDRRDHSRSSG